MIPAGLTFFPMPIWLLVLLTGFACGLFVGAFGMWLRFRWWDFRPPSEERVYQHLLREVRKRGIDVDVFRGVSTPLDLGKVPALRFIREACYEEGLSLEQTTDVLDRLKQVVGVEFPLGWRRSMDNRKSYPAVDKAVRAAITKST